VVYGAVLMDDEPPAEPRSQPIDRRAFWSALRDRHPPLGAAIREDARVTAMHRGERHAFRSRLDAALQIARLAWVSDAFAAQVLYRVKARSQARGVPLVPRVAHRLAMVLAQVSIGDPVVMQPGVYIVHGQVVIDGLAEIGPGAVIAPFVTIGLRAGDVRGPVLEAGVNVGTGAKVIGPVRVGAGAVIGANAVVVDDVAAGATVVGAPARPRPG
jgi:serine O-acetyltransferase